MDTTLKYILPDACVCSYCYVPLCQAPKAATSHGPEQEMFICYGEPPDTFDWGLRSLPWVTERGGSG
jgi:hypothetical protein